MSSLFEVRTPSDQSEGTRSQVLRWLKAVGQCVDWGGLVNVTIENLHAYGADTNGNAGPNQIGAKCISVLHDVTLSAYNYTGIPIDDTDGVVVRNSSITNFNNGFYIAAGRNYLFKDNRWYNNTGCSAVTATCVQLLQGNGGIIDYIVGGNFDSTGRPVNNVTIVGDTFEKNGNQVAGGHGILILANLIANNDKISNVNITASMFKNNINEAIEAEGPQHLRNVVIKNNQFSGPQSALRCRRKLGQHAARRLCGNNRF